MKKREDFVWYQQGDVTIKPVAALPEGAEPLPGRVLREGEATGHAHVATGADVRLFIHVGRVYLSAPSGTRVVHEEHTEQEIPPGVYVVGAIREYDHCAEEACWVAD